MIFLILSASCFLTSLIVSGIIVFVNERRKKKIKQWIYGEEKEKV